MDRLVLMARPHGNIRRQLWMLKREAFDWNCDDASMALPEGFICGWFILPDVSDENRSREAFSKQAQEMLSRHAESICAALPDTFHFRSIVEERGRTILKLDDELDYIGLNASLARFAADAGLEMCSEVPVPHAHAGIWLGSRRPALISMPICISFKKYQLVLYRAELPETPFVGFQFKTVACVHRKVKADLRTGEI
ncbi:MAG: hypothetical protein ABFC65_00090 [Rectinema sp.]